MNKVNHIKEMYPKGTKIQLDYMDDFQAPPRGSIGEVLFVDDIEQIHVRWENGSGLALNYDVDRFHKI